MSIKKPMILAVDDDEILLSIIGDTMVAAGFRVIRATNAVTALFLMAKHNPDLVILDIMMPKYDGFQALEMIRQQSNIPVIMLTCLDDQASVKKSLNEGGADGYITKPFSTKHLVAQVKAILRRVDKAYQPNKT